MTGTVLRYRRELSRLKKEVEQKKSNTDSAARLREQPSPPASIIEQVGL